MRITVLLIAYLGCVSLYAQSPHAFKYQGVVRDESFRPYELEDIEVDVSILNDQGNILMRETHNLTTSETGVFSLNIGQGTSIIGNLQSVDWSIGEYWIETRILVLNENKTITARGQLLSVPYALYALTSGSSNTNTGSDNDNDPSNELQSIELLFDPVQGFTLSLTNSDEEVSLQSLDEQTLSFEPINNILTISNGNTVDLSDLQDGGNGGAGSDDQQLTIEGAELILEDGGAPIDLSSINDQRIFYDTLTNILRLEGGSRLSEALIPRGSGVSQVLTTPGDNGQPIIGISDGNMVDLT